jgi:S-DNA-T family DNA segregation ATPase FtsK/SpoIIIE
VATKSTRKNKQGEAYPVKNTNVRGNAKPVTGLFLAALGILAAAALLSYEIGQDSTNNTNPSSANWVGMVGANFSNWALGAVGIGAWFMPVYCLGFAYSAVFGKRKRANFLKPVLLVALPFILCALAGGFGQTIDIKGGSYFPSGTLGGNLGNSIFQGFLDPWMGDFGGTVILLVGFCSASLLILTDNPGSLVDSIKASFKSFSKEQRDRIRVNREARAKLRAEAKALAERNAAQKKAEAELAAQEKEEGARQPPQPEPKKQELFNFEKTEPEEDGEILLFGDSPLPGTKAHQPSAQRETKNQEPAPCQDFGPTTDESTPDKKKRSAPPMDPEPTRPESEPQTQAPAPVVAEETSKVVPAASVQDLLPPETVQDMATVAEEEAPANLVEEEPEPEPEKKKLPPPDEKTLKIIRGEKTEKAEINIPERIGDYEFPPVALLPEPPPDKSDSQEDHEARAEAIQRTLKDFRIDVEIGEIHVGPVITRYEIYLAPGVRVEKVAGLDKNLSMALRSEGVRILAPVPGKDCVGIEVPNKKASPVFFREIIESTSWSESKGDLPIVLGKDVSGKPLVADLAKMPHLLIAGSTGSGKSVCINTIISSLCFRFSPNELRFIMVDPKVVEMQVYNTLPHMLIPVMTDPKKVPGALKWLISEMTQRYEKFAAIGVRNIGGYNAKVAKNKEEKERELIHEAEINEDMSDEENYMMDHISVPRDEDVEGELPTAKMPYIVCIIDEMADLMMVSKQDIETSIARIAQLARAAGIHLILATQRPSVNVITGIIKANLPSRIAFRVQSYRDSMTILDTKGAENLIGKGDMLFQPPGAPTFLRAQGAWLDDPERDAIVEHLKRNGPPMIIEEVQRQVENSVEGDDNSDSGEDFADDDEEANLLKKVLWVLKTTRKASTSMVQRKLKIGYNRAARIMDELEERGIVGPDNGNAAQGREILVDLDMMDL